LAAEQPAAGAVEAFLATLAAAEVSGGVADSSSGSAAARAEFAAAKGAELTLVGPSFRLAHALAFAPNPQLGPLQAP